jgi:multiple sugar transport system substrate-binding protein
LRPSGSGWDKFCTRVLGVWGSIRSARPSRKFPGGARAIAAALALKGLACGGAREAAPLELWAMGSEGEAVERLLPEFQRRHPELRVRVQRVPWSAAHEKLLTAFVGGSLPDLFQLGTTWVPELAALGALEPLEGWLGDALPERDFFAASLDANRIGGALLAIPWYVDTRVLFYRSDLVARAGASAPPRSWAEWTALLARIQQQAAPGHHAILVPLREWQLPVILALQRGAALLRDGGRYGNFRGEEFRAAFEFYLDLFERGFAPAAGDALASNLYRDFAEGRFCFYVTGPWNLGEFARRLPPERADDWSTAPMPGPGSDGPGISLAGGAGLALSRGSARKAEARALIEFLSAPEQQVAFYALTGDLPARRSAWRDPSLRDDPRARAFFTQLDSSRTTPKVPEWERIAAKISHYAERTVRGSMTVDDALSSLDEEVDAILEKRRWLLERGGTGSHEGPTG